MPSPTVSVHLLNRESCLEAWKSSTIEALTDQAGLALACGVAAARAFLEENRDYPPFVREEIGGRSIVRPLWVEEEEGSQSILPDRVEAILRDLLIVLKARNGDATEPGEEDPASESAGVQIAWLKRLLGARSG